MYGKSSYEYKSYVGEDSCNLYVKHYHFTVEISLSDLSFLPEKISHLEICGLLFRSKEPRLMGFGLVRPPVGVSTLCCER